MDLTRKRRSLCVWPRIACATSVIDEAKASFGGAPLMDVETVKTTIEISVASRLIGSAGEGSIKGIWKYGKKWVRRALGKANPERSSRPNRMRERTWRTSRSGYATSKQAVGCNVINCLQL